MRIVTLAARALVLLATIGTAAATAADRPVDRTAGRVIAATSDRAASAQRGGRLFRTVGCVHCHGSAGQGSVLGARLVPNPLPAPAIAQFLRSTATNMPPYSAQLLSDADVADIAAYLASIPRPKSPDEIPALRALKTP